MNIKEGDFMKTKRLITIGMLAALCFTATFIHIPVTAKSMIHLGTTAIFISAVLIGPEAGWAGAIGCALFDLLNPAYAAYAIPTFIIKGLQGYSAGKIAFSRDKKGLNFTQNLIGFIFGSIVSILGYFLVDWMVLSNWAAAIENTFGSLMSSALGIVFSLAIASALIPIMKKSNINL